MIQFLVPLILSTVPGTYAQESPGYTICKNKSIVRTIRVEKVSGTDDYITLYTKFGKDKEVGRAKWKPSAENIQINIKSNLEKAGWTCRDAKDFKVTGSQD